MKIKAGIHRMLSLGVSVLWDKKVIPDGSKLVIDIELLFFVVVIRI